MHRFIVKDYDGNAIICGSWRKAKAELRKALAESYTAWILPYRGHLKTGTIITE
jgi:hypothetical protein